MICPICNSENRPGAKFCDECGARLLSEQVAIDHMEEAFGTEDQLEERFGSFSLSQFEASADEDPAAGYDPDPEDESNAQENPDDSQDLYDSEDSYNDDFVEPENPVVADHINEPAEASASETVALPKAVKAASAGETVDLKALRAQQAQALEDEKLAGLDQSNYDEMAMVTPWDKGNTMRMKPLDDHDVSKQRKFVSSEGDTKAAKSKKPLIIALIVVLLAGLVAFGTWYFELWGGYKIPDVVALNSDQATSVLKEKGFTVRIEKVKSDDEEGIVLLTDPQAGSRMNEGGEVVLQVAVAREVPSLVGLSEDEAKKKIAAEGFTNVSYSTEKSNEPEGTVLAVSPDPGTKQKAAYPIRVTVAESYRVPDVVGKSKEEAMAALHEEGYQIKVEREYTESQKEGTVLSTSPEADEKLNSGETVTIYVAISRETELLETARDTFYTGAKFTVGGYNYLVKSVNGVKYEGNDVTSLDLTVQAYGYIATILVYLDPEDVTWTVKWTADNEIASISK